MHPTPPLVALTRYAAHQIKELYYRASYSSLFARYYTVSCVAVLFATAALWSIWGASVQMHNADQLADPYMFSSWNTFRQALFPGAHTFLLKWPIFGLLGYVGISIQSLAAATVGVVLLTLAV